MFAYAERFSRKTTTREPKGALITTILTLKVEPTRHYML